MTPAQKLAGLVLLILVLMAGAAGAAWQVQDWRMGEKLAEQAGQFEKERGEVSAAAAKQASEETVKRLTLEQRLTESDQQHSKELFDAQRNQARLRDRLATADVRLSVLIEDTASG